MLADELAAATTGMRESQLRLGCAAADGCTADDPGYAPSQ